MSRAIYTLVGVVRPMIDPQELNDRATRYQELAGSLGLAISGIDSNVIGEITANNSGPATVVAAGSLAGPGSTRYALSALRDAAIGFGVAHGHAAQVLSRCLQQMDAVAGIAQRQLQQLPTETYARMLQRRLVLEWAQDQLNTTARQGAGLIADAYRAVRVPQLPDAPATLPQADDPYFGIVDPRIRAHWAGLTREQRRDLIEEMIRERARANGQNPDDIPITWRNEPDETWMGRREASLPWSKGITMNEAYLDDPTMMHVAEHEMQHERQVQMKKDYERMSPAERQAIRDGAQADPFARYGSSIDRVEQTSHDPYRSSDPRYLPSPVEVDARRAGREHGSTMTWEQYQAHHQRAERRRNP